MRDFNSRSLRVEKCSERSGRLRAVFALVAWIGTAQCVNATSLDGGELPGDGASSSGIAVPGELFDSELIASNVARVLARADKMLNGDRFQFLAQWVLPKGNPQRIRVSGQFIPVDLSPPVASYLAGARIRCGNIVSPVFDLVHAAAASERLEELERRILATTPTTNLQRRKKWALLLMVAMESGQKRQAITAADRLRTLVIASAPTKLEDMWPETLAVAYGLHRIGARAESNDVLSTITAIRTEPSLPRGVFRIHRQMAALQGYLKFLLEGVSPNDCSDAVDTPNWISTTRSYSQTRGHAFSRSAWHFDDRQLQHVASHDEDYLLFRSPLRGDFQIEGEIVDRGMNQLLIGGRYCGPHGAAKLVTGTFRVGDTHSDMIPPFGWFDPVLHYRAEVKDNRCITFVNGRPVDDRLLNANSDPWVGLRCVPKSNATFRNFRVTGDPVIPASLDLSADSQLSGWHGYNRYSWNQWSHRRDQDSSGLIIGKHRPELVGTHCEDLFRYIRPLQEGGTVSYDFMYVPGTYHTHPALDRLVFLLEEDGVRIHWVTDDVFDRTSLLPNNSMPESEPQRAGEKLPLRTGHWNHMKMVVAGNAVSLYLNQQFIFERPLNDGNRRTFGLFHFAGQAEARVRNVVMRGNWPTVLSSVDRQELANRAEKSLDEHSMKFDEQLRHDFAADGLPTTLFSMPRSQAAMATIRPQAEGVYQSIETPKRWSAKDLQVKARLFGDFDVSVAFTELTQVGDDFASMLLSITFSGKPLERRHFIRMKLPDGRHTLKASSTVFDGRKVDKNQLTETCEAMSGQLRLCRRGDQLYYLFAEGNSPNFRILTQQTVPTTPTVAEGISLRVLADRNSKSSVLWKTLQIAAEEVEYGAIRK